MNGGVAAYSNSWKLDTFSTNAANIDLKIEHSFWSSTVVTSDDGYIVSNVTLTNIGNVALDNVQVYVDVDDDSSEFDAHICDSNGNIIDASDTPCLVFGHIPAGATASQKSYWWIVKPRFPDAEGTAQKTVSFNLYPVFTADFRQSRQTFVSQSALAKA